MSPLAACLNDHDDATVKAALTRCCASRAWVEQMASARPFPDDAQALDMAGSIWRTLGPDDWREAFAAHPQIGDLNSLRAKYADTRNLAGGEQAGVTGASDETLEQLAALNRAYLARFGYIFIVCATGKSADDMLSILQRRLPNSPEAELPIAAAEQLKITLLRLRKLVP